MSDADEIERLRRGLEAVQSIGCGIPGHAVATGCQRALAAQAVLGGWEPNVDKWGTVSSEAWEYAQRWVDEANESGSASTSNPKDARDRD